MNTTQYIYLSGLPKTGEMRETRGKMEGLRHTVQSTLVNEASNRDDKDNPGPLSQAFQLWVTLSCH